MVRSGRVCYRMNPFHFPLVTARLYPFPMSATPIQIATGICFQGAFVIAGDSRILLDPDPVRWSQGKIIGILIENLVQKPRLS